MLILIENFQRYPTVENAQRLREYFERNPSRLWVLRSEFLRVLAAAGVRALNKAGVNQSGSAWRRRRAATRS